MNEDLQSKITELEDEIQMLKEERTREKTDYETRISAVEKILKEHTHRGDDDSSPIEKDIELLSGQKFVSGEVSSFSGFTEKTSAIERTISLISSGNDENAADGIMNSQLGLEHQQSSDTSTRQTFFYGLRGPLYQGTTSIKSGGTELTQSSWSWQTNALAGARVIVYNSTNTTFDGFTIESNSEKTLTITGGTWNFEGNGLFYQVFMPVYLGGANYPWRRIYMEEGTGGGLRIGLGATGGGQNGLLYMDAAGDLYWRNKAGSSTKLN